MVGTVGFSKLRNNASGSNANYGLTGGAVGPYANQTVKGARYSDFNLYINDTTTVDTFPEYVGHENPAWTFLSDESIGTQQNLHVFQYINKFKTMELSFWGLGGSQCKEVGGIARPAKNLPVEGDKSWGQWRDPNINLAHIGVDPKVLLFPKELNFSFSYGHKLASAYSKLSESGGLKKLSDAMEVARTAAVMLGGAKDLQTGGKVVSRYQQVPMWEGCSPIKFDGQLNFEFQFGNYGLFSGEHEVVRPILALASMWTPIAADNLYMWGIAPTGPTYLMELVKQAPSGIMGAIKEIAEGVAGENGAGIIGVVNTLSSIEQELHAAVNRALLAGASRIKTVYFRIGRMIFGPLIIKDVKFSFDFTQVDEYGFPYKGSIELGGAEQIFTATADMFVGMFDGITGGVGSVTGGENSTRVNTYNSNAIGNNPNPGS